MRIESTKSSFNLYESFSDLIFCALVLFLVIVLVLALNVGESKTSTDALRFELASAVENRDLALKELEELKEGFSREKEVDPKDYFAAKTKIRELEEQIRLMASNTASKTDIDAELVKLRNARSDLERLSGSTRFTGIFGRTTYNFAVDTRRKRFILVPSWLSSELSTTPVGMSSEKHRASVLKKWNALRRQLSLLKEDELASILSSVGRYIPTNESGDGLPKTIVATTNPTFSFVASGLVDTDLNITRSAKARAVATNSTIEKLQNMEYHDSASELIRRKGLAADPSLENNQVPTIYVELSGRNVVLGGRSFHPEVLVQFLQSVGGAGLVVEFVPSKLYPELPQWFEDQVLRPSGYINRSPQLKI